MRPAVTREPRTATKAGPFVIAGLAVACLAFAALTAACSSEGHPFADEPLIDGDGGIDAGSDASDGDDGSYPDDDNPCGPGLRPGACGLAGECVECNGDWDCPSESRCSDQGICEAWCDGHGVCPDGAYCDDGVCRQQCTSHWQCRPDAICRVGGCFQERCTPEGRCPEGWAAIPASIACKPVSCEAVGLIDGQCGFAGGCTQCNRDEDCWAIRAELCTFGSCVVTGDEWHCTSDEDCHSPFQVCRNGDCIEPCDEDVECVNTSVCTHGVCETMNLQCPPEGVCPEGYRTHPGTIACVYFPCDDESLVPGGCGLRGQCLECLGDEQCPDGLICDLTGSCRQPECASDADCPEGFHCHRQRCNGMCHSDDDCSLERRCDPYPAGCVTQRCTLSGRCPFGLVPSDGSLACSRRE